MDMRAGLLANKEVPGVWMVSMSSSTVGTEGRTDELMGAEKMGVF